MANSILIEEVMTGLHWSQIFLQNVFIQAANVVTFIVNDADLARYARRPKDALWTQLIAFPISFGSIAFFGIIITSASVVTIGSVRRNQQIEFPWTYWQSFSSQLGIL